MAERVGNGAERGAFHDGQRVVREPRRALRERPEHGRATSRELVTNTAACNDHRSLGAAEQDGPFRRSRSPLHAVMAPVFRLALVPAATRISGTPLTLSSGSVSKSCGTRRACTACSKPEVSLINVGSLKAVPMKLMPTGRPKTFPIGTLTIA